MVMHCELLGRGAHTCARQPSEIRRAYAETEMLVLWLLSGSCGTCEVSHTGPCFKTRPGNRQPEPESRNYSIRSLILDLSRKSPARTVLPLYKLRSLRTIFRSHLGSVPLNLLARAQ
jgi:hypothetical protein